MNSVYGKGPVSFHDITCLGTPTGFGPAPQPELTYYVKKQGGSDSNNGRSWKGALKTYQAGVTLATRASNKWKNVDLIIASGEYDEEVIVSGVAQGDYYNTLTYWALGRLRIIAAGGEKGYVLKNSGLKTSHTIDILKKKVEFHGGVFRQYEDEGDLAAVHWDRNSIITLGDTNAGAMYGCRVEGRSGAQIGIDFDAAVYIHIEDCWISGFVYGVLEAANGFGYPLENVLFHNRFRDNTYDIMLGGSTFFLMEKNIHMDAGTTQFIGVSTKGGRTGNVTDALCVNGRFNGSGWAKLPEMSGVKFVGTAFQDR